MRYVEAETTLPFGALGLRQVKVGGLVSPHRNIDQSWTAEVRHVWLLLSGMDMALDVFPDISQKYLKQLEMNLISGHLHETLPKGDTHFDDGPGAA